MRKGCKEIQELIIEAESGASIDVGKRQAIREHVTHCRDCQAFSKEIPSLLRTLKSPTLSSPPDSFFEDIKRNVMETVAPDKADEPVTFRAFLRRISSVFSRHPILSPVMAGGVGIIVGVSIALSLSQHSSPPLSAKNSLPFQIQANTTPPNTALSDIESFTLSDMEEYLGADTVLEALEDQDSSDFSDSWLQDETFETAPDSETHQTG